MAQTTREPSSRRKEKRRGAPAGERERTRRNQSGSVTRSRGEERGPTRTTATHCPTHRHRRCSCFYLSIQETYPDAFSLHSLICRFVRRLDRSETLDTQLHWDLYVPEMFGRWRWEFLCLLPSLQANILRNWTFCITMLRHWCMRAHSDAFSSIFNYCFLFIHKIHRYPLLEVRLKAFLKSITC